jgi:hypothetical protein
MGTRFCVWLYKVKIFSLSHYAIGSDSGGIYGESSGNNRHRKFSAGGMGGQRGGFGWGKRGGGYARHYANLVPGTLALP